MNSSNHQQVGFGGKSKFIARLTVTAAAAGAMLFAPAEANAEVRAGAIEAGVYGGYNFFQSSQNLDDAPIVGVRLGYNFNEHWAIEAAAERISTNVDDRTITSFKEGQFRAPTDKVRAELYYLDAVYHFNPSGRLSPYVLAGLGGIDYKPSISRDDGLLLIANVGVGTKYWLADNLAFRFELKDNMVTEAAQETYHNIGVTAGLSYAFGGRKAPVQTAAFVPTPVRAADPPRVATYVAPAQTDFVGRAGVAGPAGHQGEQGPTGYTGAQGIAIAGPRGAQGPAGPTGVRGPSGPMGAEGDIAVGPAGVAGPMGPAGAQGERGWTGEQGASAEGYVGPTGYAGPQGPEGDRGMTGPQGPTLVGPAGPAGAQGNVGVTGDRGSTGAQGAATAGVSGPKGTSGVAGPQGADGPIGPQGATGVVERWTSYRDFWFDGSRDVMWQADARKVAEIAAYLRQNPSLKIGIDHYIVAAPSSQALRQRRVSNIYNALINGGVPSSKIEFGLFGNPANRRTERVEVLIKTR